MPRVACWRWIGESRAFLNPPVTLLGQDRAMDRQQEFVLRTIEERDIRFVRLWFTDVLGQLKSVAVAPAELEGAFAEASASTAAPSRASPGCTRPTCWSNLTPGRFRCCLGVARTREPQGCSATSCCRMAPQALPIHGSS